MSWRFDRPAQHDNNMSGDFTEDRSNDASDSQRQSEHWAKRLNDDRRSRKEFAVKREIRIFDDEIRRGSPLRGRYFGKALPDGAAKSLHASTRSAGFDMETQSFLHCNPGGEPLATPSAQPTDLGRHHAETAARDRTKS